MRVVFYGLCDLTLKTVEKFIEEGHEVIIIDPDKEKTEEASETLDCGFLLGEASSPSILKEVNPENTDFFFALSGSGQNNIVACLVARSLGIKRTILKIEDPDYENVCEELGLREVIMPSQITSQYLFDLIFNDNLLELFNFMKDKAILYKVVVSEEEEGDVSKLKLSSAVRVICYFKKGQFYHFEEDVEFQKGDEIILLTDHSHIKELTSRWSNN